MLSRINNFGISQESAMNMERKYRCRTNIKLIINTSQVIFWLLVNLIRNTCTTDNNQCINNNQYTFINLHFKYIHLIGCIALLAVVDHASLLFYKIAKVHRRLIKQITKLGGSYIGGVLIHFCFDCPKNQWLGGQSDT